MCLICVMIASFCYFIGMGVLIERYRNEPQNHSMCTLIIEFSAFYVIELLMCIMLYNVTYTLENECRIENLEKNFLLLRGSTGRI